MSGALIEPVARLIEAFARLPGIGPKTAQRLTYHLLRAPETEARALAAALVALREEVVFCRECHNISDAELCPICRDPVREQTRLCVVEEPLDVLAIERTSSSIGSRRPGVPVDPSKRSSWPRTRPSRVRRRRCISPSSSTARSGP
jgi:recombinational DNA repair protein RecR